MSKPKPKKLKALTVIRSSSLDIRRFCSGAPGLDLGSGRSAAVSTACHAHFSDPESEESQRALVLLTPDERDAIKGWRKPYALAVIGVQLDYDQAITEKRLWVDGDWKPFEGPEDPNEGPVGTKTGKPDMMWLLKGRHQLEFGHPDVDTIVVGDLKKTGFAAPHPSASLQMIDYLLMAAAYHPKATTALLAHWLLEESRWVTSEPIDLRSLGAAVLYDLVEAAAENDSGFATGPHCSHCWSRLRCPAHMVALGDRMLVPGLGTEDEPTAEEIAAGLVLAKSQKDTAEAFFEYAEEWVNRHGPVVHGDKEWGPSMREGRACLDKGALREFLAEHGKEIANFEGRGEPFQVFSWKKARKR